jgi:hypothetical protein
MTKANRQSADTGTSERRTKAAAQQTATSGQQASPGQAPGTAGDPQTGFQQPRVVSRPEDVAGLVLMQIDLVNARKDDLTIAIKGLSDLTRQLVRAYGENMQTIQELQKKVGKQGSGSKPDNGKGK